MIFLNYRLEFKVAWFKPKALSTIIYAKIGLNWFKPSHFWSLNRFNPIYTVPVYILY